MDCHLPAMRALSVRRYASVPTDIRTSPGPAAVKTQRPITSEEEHQVLQFRPRSSLRASGRQGYQRGPAKRDQARPEPNDLSRYERPRDEPDDFRQRMLANVAAIAFTVALMAIGIWL